MSKVKSLVMDSMEEFYNNAEHIIKNAKSLSQAKEHVEIMRNREFNWLDKYQISDEQKEESHDPAKRLFKTFSERVSSEFCQPTCYFLLVQCNYLSQSKYWFRRRRV